MFPPSSSSSKPGIVANGMDARLVFDCLMYINIYYFFMFTIANLGIWTAKNTEPNFDTPNIYQDAYVAATLSSSELAKLLLFERFRKRYKEWSVVIAVFFTTLSVFAVLYVFMIQDPVLRLEMCLDSMLFVLLIGEIIYGIYSLLPCCAPRDVW